MLNIMDAKLIIKVKNIVDAKLIMGAKIIVAFGMVILQNF